MTGEPVDRPRRRPSRREDGAAPAPPPAPAPDPAPAQDPAPAARRRARPGKDTLPAAATDAAARLAEEGFDPVMELARIAQAAEAEGRHGDAIAALRTLLPYVCPRPKPVETDTEGVIELARALRDLRQEDTSENFSLRAMLAERDRRERGDP